MWRREDGEYVTRINETEYRVRKGSTKRRGMAWFVYAWKDGRPIPFSGHFATLRDAKDVCEKRA